MRSFGPALRTDAIREYNVRNSKEPQDKPGTAIEPSNRGFRSGFARGDHHTRPSRAQRTQRSRAMSGGRGAVAGTLVVASLMVTSVLALPMLGGGIVQTDDSGAEIDASAEGEPAAAGGSPPGTDADGSSANGGEMDASGTDVARSIELASLEPPTEANAGASLSTQQEDAVEAGVDEGIELVQSQGVEVTQEQRAAAIEGASESVAQHQEAEVEQVQEATKGAVHGSLIQEQRVEVEQIQYAVNGATDGALSQHQTVTASQMQSATWGATHGAVAQEQRATVEQIQVATRGGAAGAASEAGDKNVTDAPTIQEAAQGASYGVLEQYQQITVEQRQQVTLEHVQYAAAGASAGALEGTTEAALDQDQRVEVEQRQRVDIKQVQKAATGAAKGALVQRQEVSVEQTQSAAHGASMGSLKQVQSVSVEQVQRISITQIQEASFGAAKGSITQSQAATVEQIQAAADGAAGGVLVQQQEVSITQIQHAAVGASAGAIRSAIQYQDVEVTQIQAAAYGAGEGAVIQKQIVDVTQVQTLATGGASGALVQYQEATVEQIQIAARGACEETARAVQYQRISVSQLQILTEEAATDATEYAIQEGIDDPAEINQYLEVEISQRIETVDEPEGTAAITFADQESDGESIVVDSVDLSDGGFVALYGGDSVADPTAVIGSSDYLESGEHEDVEIEFENPLEEEQPLLAVVHRDTTGDETFQYAESDGAEDDPYVTPAGSPVLDTAFVTVGDSAEPDDPEATLSVTDQVGDGETLAVDEAGAPVEYTVTASSDGTEAESETFEANRTVTDLELDLEPPLEENATVDVAVVDEGGAELANESIEYALEDGDGPPADDVNATLNVTDQTGDGETVTVEEANADVAYVLTATDEDGERLAESGPFEANETVAFESLDLEPPLEENATLEVAVETADDGANETGTGAGDVLESETIEYTVDGDPETFEATFVDCSRAEVTGSFEEGDTIIVATGFYQSGGFGNTMGEYAITVGDDVEAPFEGTVTYEIGDEFAVDETAEGATVTVPGGDFGAAITGFASPDATPGSIDHPNPDAGDCLESVRPELPELSVEETTPTEDAIEVTFGYTNPNDAELLVDSEFVEGTTAAEPVDELEPGTNSFTVEWTPEDDDERLVWAVDMSFYDYDEDAVAPAQTDAAGEIDPTDPAEFAVSIADTNDPVEQGEPLEVDAAIENVGDGEGTQNVSLSVAGDTVDEQSVSLEPESAEDVTLTAETDDLEPGDYPIEVSSENETAETTVTIEETGEPEFAVTDFDAPETAEPGDEVTVSATIENVGESEGTQTVSYSVDEQDIDEETLDLESGESETVTFSSTMPADDSTHTIATDDDQASATIETADEPDPAEEEPADDELPTEEPTDEPPTEDSGDEPDTEAEPGNESPSDDPVTEDPTDEPFGEPDEDGAGEPAEPTETESPVEPAGPGGDSDSGTEAPAE